MDLYLHNTCIEFKKDIVRNGLPVSDYIEQLDGYLESLLKAGTGVRNGILTDGINYFLRRVGEEKLPLQQHPVMSIFDRAEQSPRLREYLHGIISAPAEDLRPTAENLERFFGSKSDGFHASNLLLQEAYEAHRDDPTVSVKRRLWQDLLQVALGKDAATGGKESDWLFIRHTYITSLIAVIMQQQLLGEVSRHASERPDALLKGSILAEQSDLHGIIDADLFTWPTEVGESTYLREIARVAEQFDWTQDAKEVAPTLYQNVITQEERKRLGEYYTPRWLARGNHGGRGRRPPEPEGAGPILRQRDIHRNRGGENHKPLREPVSRGNAGEAATEHRRDRHPPRGGPVGQGNLGDGRRGNNPICSRRGKRSRCRERPHLPGRLHATALRHRYPIRQPIHRTGNPRNSARPHGPHHLQNPQRTCPPAGRHGPALSPKWQLP